MNKRQLIRLVLFIAALTGAVFAQNATAVLLDFEAQGITPEESKVFTEHLRVELFNREAYTLLEIPDVQRILERADYSLESCSDTACLAKVGELTGSDYAIGGSIYNDGKQFIVRVSMVDVSKAEVVRSFTFRHPENIVSLMSEGSAIVANRLAEPLEEKSEETAKTIKPSDAPSIDRTQLSAPLPSNRKPGGIGPALASCLIGPRVGLEMNEGIEGIHQSEWIALGGSMVAGSATGFIRPLGSVILTGTRVYMAYDMGGINNGIEGAFASYCLGPRVGNELHYRKIRDKEWLQLCLIGKILITLEAYEGKTMTEIEMQEGLRK